MTQASEAELELLDRVLERGARDRARDDEAPRPHAATATPVRSRLAGERDPADDDSEADRLAALLTELASRDAPPAPRTLRHRLLASVRETSGLAGFAPRMAELLDWPQDEAAAQLRESAAAMSALAAREPGRPSESDDPALPDEEPHPAPTDAWLPGPAPGLRIRPVQPGRRHGVALAGLVWCAPGSVFPEHSHVGPEWALVLSGEAYDSTGAHWAVGDLVHQPAGSHHRFEIPPDGPPLLAVVVVREGFTLT